MWGYDGLCRPRVRLVVIGLVLVLLGAVVVTSSVWTLPLLLVGAVMLVIAWVGARLEGRLAVQWGETGTEFELRARINAPARPELTTARPAAGAEDSPSGDSEPEDAQVVDGEAHTIEIDVAELKALIAAAESGSQPGVPAAGEQPAEDTTIQVADMMSHHPAEPLTETPTNEGDHMPDNLDDAKGKLKEKTGEATSDDGLKDEGKTDQAAGKVKEAVDSVKDKLTEKAEPDKSKAEHEAEAEEQGASDLQHGGLLG